ncbi:MAG: hypothetical protein L0Y71_23200 [Gemmataceae bacterium]|nr:hypothetical protein [Gemmataceae bacterium]
MAVKMREFWKSDVIKTWGGATAHAAPTQAAAPVLRGDDAGPGPASAVQGAVAKALTVDAPQMGTMSAAPAGAPLTAGTNDASESSETPLQHLVEQKMLRDKLGTPRSYPERAADEARLEEINRKLGQIANRSPKSPQNAPPQNAPPQEPPPKPDPKMLEQASSIGYQDGVQQKQSRMLLFANAPEFQKRYEEGYARGWRIAELHRAKGPQPEPDVMKPISQTEAERSKEYTRRKQARKEFIKYLNKWWKTRLPEDL